MCTDLQLQKVVHLLSYCRVAEKVGWAVRTALSFQFITCVLVSVNVGTISRRYHNNLKLTNHVLFFSRKCSFIYLITWIGYPVSYLININVSGYIQLSKYNLCKMSLYYCCYYYYNCMIPHLLIKLLPNGLCFTLLLHSNAVQEYHNIFINPKNTRNQKKSEDNLIVL